MLTKYHAAASLILLVASVCAAPAQVDKFKTAAPAVAVSLTATGVRFTALGNVGQTRLEVFGPGREVVYDSGFLPGGVRDWTPQEASGRALGDGVYRCVVTARDLAGRLGTKPGTILVRDGRAASSAIPSSRRTRAGSSSEPPRPSTPSKCARIRRSTGRSAR